MHTLPACSGDVHQRIKREPRNASAQQVADSRLRHTTLRGSLNLRPAVSDDQFRNLVHQLRAHAEIRSLFRRVGNCVPDAFESIRLRLFHIERLSVQRIAPWLFRCAPHSTRIAKRNLHAHAIDQQSNLVTSCSYWAKTHRVTHDGIAKRPVRYFDLLPSAVTRIVRYVPRHLFSRNDRKNRLLRRDQIPQMKDMGC